ncbi:MAG TPA: hypothetical protein VFS19_00920 [Planctomycetota bacterium]|nr:hypothetical protein [Planctomycetota bacterium]
MKIAAGILALVLLQAQEKPALAWNPPAGKVLIAKSKARFIYPGKSESSFECDSELHPTGETAKAGRVFTVRVNRLQSLLRERVKDKDKESEVLFERGKETVLKGEALEGSGPFKGIGDDHQAVISPLGRRDSDQLNDHLAESMCLGVVDLQLGAGSTWESEVHVPFQGDDFIGTLKYKVERIEKGKTARIAIKAVERGPVAGEDGVNWSGTGTLVYSFEDSLIREFKISVKKTDKDGNLVASLDQELTVSLKP